MAKSKAKSKSTALVVSQPSGAVPKTKPKRKRSKKKSNALIHPYAGLLIDPKNAKLDYAHPPDPNPRPTVMFKSVQNWNYSCNASGNGWLEIRPMPNSIRQEHSLTATTISTINAGYAGDDYTAISAAFSALRPVVMVVEVEYIGEAQLAKGSIALCVSDNPPAVGWTLANMADEPYYTEMSVAHEGNLAAVCRYTPETWYAITATALGTGHPRVFLLVEGLPVSLPNLRVRVSYVNEYLCASNSLLQTQARYSPSLPLEFASAQSINDPSAIVQSGVDAFGKIVKTAKHIYSTVLAINRGYESFQAIMEGASLLAL